MAKILIEKYGDHPLIGGAHFLEERGFWPAYLAATTGVRDHQFLCDAFGLDHNDLNACYGRLADTARWPAFIIPLSTGAQVIVIFRNREGDAGTDFVLRSADRTDVLAWVRLDGHFLAPGLSWPELVGISSRPGSGEGVLEHHARMLLLLPATGDADPPASALPALASALTAAGAAEHAAAPLAGELLNHPLGGTAHWRRGKDGITVCDAFSSRRNPASPAALSPSEALFLSEAIRDEGLPVDARAGT